MLGGHDHHYIQLVWIVASAFGLVALAILICIYRQAKRRHELEQCERIIAEHELDR